MLSPRGVRRAAFFIYIVAIALMIALLFLGHNAKGATRWVEIAGFTLQPSEFMKPALIVLVAWMFSEGQKGEGVPGVSIAFCLYLLVGGPAADAAGRRPDGADHRRLRGGVLDGRRADELGHGAGRHGAGGLGSTLFPVPARRQPGRTASSATTRRTDTHQVDRAAQAIAAGGLFGRGPGEGIMKREVPDMHTDFAYSAAAEEYGLWFSLLLIALFMFLILRGLFKAMRLSDPFEQVAAARPLRAGRHAGLHQHRREPRPDADQGHDAAVHLLWRLLDAGDGPDHGHGAGADPPPARRLRPGRPRRQAGAFADAAPGKLAVVAAGGTGGHLFPAQALAEVLSARGWRVVLATDERGADLVGQLSRPSARIPLSAATFKPGDPLGMAQRRRGDPRGA